MKRFFLTITAFLFVCTIAALACGTHAFERRTRAQRSAPAYSRIYR
ncbi:MAG: hypothetical protein IJB34_02040 [Clostridia bacterium]|nr:hypothetical protein [Clostridia bacterium]